MARLPVVSGREAIRALSKAGFIEMRQAGSHVVLQRKLPGTTIPWSFQTTRNWRPEHSAQSFAKRG